jgi:hypothetical protein
MSPKIRLLDKKRTSQSKVLVDGLIMIQAAQLHFRGLKLCMGLISVSLLLASCTNQVQKGAEAFERGDYDIAAGYWNADAKAGNMYAEYNLALLWEQGLGTTPKNTSEASQWFLRSAQHGYIPAMVRLARLQRIGGLAEAPLSWLTLAARWGNNDAIAELNAWGKPVPTSDLLFAQQQKDAIAEAQVLEALGPLAYQLGCAIAGHPCAPPEPSPTSVYERDSPSVVNSCEDGHWIKSVTQGGEIVILENNSVWEVSSLDRIYTTLWLPVTEVVACPNQLINVDDGEKVEAVRIK